MKNPMPLLLALFSSLFSSCQLGLKDESAFTNAPRHFKKPYVLLISIDGYRHDYTTRYNPPNLKKFMKKGIQAEGLISVYPSKTFPNHYSIATGMHPENHGIVSNSFWDPARKQHYRLGDPASMKDGSWYGGEPLWVATTKAQMVSASYFWVGSEANIQGIHPTYWFPYNGAVPHRERIDQVLKWFHLPAKTRPHFVSLYFSKIDQIGHRFGPESPEMKKAVLDLDRDLGYLFKGLKKIKLDINTIILSDHGMQKVGENKTLYLTDYIELSPEIRIEGRGSLYLFYVPNHALRDKLYKKLKKVSHFDVYKRENMPDKYRYRKSPRIGNLILSVRAPYYMKLSRPFVSPAQKTGGTHGYDPFKNKHMQGIFYARGPQILDKDTIPPFQNIHIYPFIMNILGLKVRNAIDGKAEVLSPYIAKKSENGN